MIKGRGGAGRGQGRKPVDVTLKREVKAIRLPAWIWQWIDQQENDRGHVIEEALKQHYQISLGDELKDVEQGEQ
ncbi:MAG: hypothetical protein PHI97_24465 [Desulfobulbus sp.]|nr:hypothetical protein [Desulfobulbus sp.]